MHRHLIDNEVVAQISEQGCLGRYAVPFSDGHYCYLEGIYHCLHQDRQFVKDINGYMLKCGEK